MHDAPYWSWQKYNGHMFNSRDWGNRVHVYIFVLIIIAVGCHFKLLTSSTLLHDNSIYDINIWTCIYKRWTSTAQQILLNKRSFK